MSRIGKTAIKLPQGLEATFDGGVFKVKGPKGELTRKIDSKFAIDIADGAVKVSLKKDNASDSSIWGTIASHVSNMIEGASKGFEKKLQIEGIGFKGEVKGKEIVFGLGFSHPVNVPIPEGLTVTIEKGIISVVGSSKDHVGAFAAYIRSLKKPEPYKGKGIRYVGEVVQIKQGKKTA